MICILIIIEFELNEFTCILDGYIIKISANILIYN